MKDSRKWRKERYMERERKRVRLDACTYRRQSGGHSGRRCPSDPAPPPSWPPFLGVDRSGPAGCRTQLSSSLESNASNIRWGPDGSKSARHSLIGSCRMNSTVHFQVTISLLDPNQLAQIRSIGENARRHTMHRSAAFMGFAWLTAGRGKWKGENESCDQSLHRMR